MSTRIKFAAVFVVLFFAGLIQGTSQKDDKKAAREAAITKKIHDKHFTFNAEQALPTGGRTRQLQPGYTLKVEPHKIVADLPYYGRAYSAPINSDEAGIKFTSTKFEYKVEPKKKGGWDITIKPQDGSSVREINITAYSNGSCYIQVNSTNKQPMSFDGHLDEK
jgi:hypothetical protein